MKAMWRISLVCVLVVLSSSFSTMHSAAQINTSLNYGVYVGGNLNMHTPSFFAKPFVNNLLLPSLQHDTTAKFGNNASSFGLAIGGIVNIPLNSMFVLSGRIGYNGVGGTLNTQSYVKSLMNSVDSASSELTMQSSISYIEISPILQIHNLIENTPLYIAAGFEVGIPLSAKYSVSENITGTNTIPSPNPNPTQYSTDAAISNSNTRIALSIGAGWPIAVGEHTFLTPEITYHLPFAKISSSSSFDSWSVPQLRFGVNLTLSSTGNSTSLPPKSTLQTGFDGTGFYDSFGNFQNLEQVRVEDVSYSELYPMLPYMFYPQNSATPSDTMQRLFDPGQKGSFSIMTLTPDALEINKSTLDIIGARLQQYPAAKLTIIGTYDGKGEVKNKGLSLQRADFAKQYIKSNYSISEERLNVQSRDLPEKYSTTTLPDGDAENRRVEFKSLTPEILDPILMKSDNQRIASPDFVEFRPFARSNYPLSTWNLSISQAGRNLREFSGIGDPTPQRWLIRPNELSDKQVPIDYSLTVSDSSGAKSEANGSLHVEYLSSTKKKVEQLSDRTISKFSLVLFDFDKSDLTPENQRILETIVLPAVQYNSTVKIFGYTDRIGDAEYNRKLSTNRATTIKNAISAKVKDAKYEIYGLGKSVPIFDNSLPIGRQLSRTVQIYVETPK